MSVAAAMLVAMADISAAQGASASKAWVNLALGGGAFGCDVCDDRSIGVTGGLTIGRDLSTRVSMGAGATLWFGSTPRTTSATTNSSGGQLAATLGPLIRVHSPQRTGLFAEGGVGLGFAGEPGTLGGTNWGPATVANLGYMISEQIGLQLGWSGVWSSRNPSDVLFAGLSITVR